MLKAGDLKTTRSIRLIERFHRTVAPLGAELWPLELRLSHRLKLPFFAGPVWDKMATIPGVFQIQEKTKSNPGPAQYCKQDESEHTSHVPLFAPKSGLFCAAQYFHVKFSHLASPFLPLNFDFW